MSVAAAGEILANVGLAVIARRQKKVLQEQLDTGLSMDMLREMDANSDGQVSREEYVNFMLQEMGLVTKDDLDELQGQFKRLDVTKSGYLDQNDLVLMKEFREAGIMY